MRIEILIPSAQIQKSEMGEFIQVVLPKEGDEVQPVINIHPECTIIIQPDSIQVQA